MRPDLSLPAHRTISTKTSLASATVVDAGQMVAAEWTWTGKFTGDRPTGPVKVTRISGRGVSVVLTQNGQIKRFSDYYDISSFFPKAPTGAANSNK